MRLLATIDPRNSEIEEWRQKRHKRHKKRDPRVAKLRRSRRFPRWWEASYGSGVGDGESSWAIFLRDVTNRPGWSVARLARESGINRSTLFRWLAGKGGLTIASVRQIAQAVEVDMSVAMLAAGDVLGPPKVEEDAELRLIMESNLPDAKKAALVAHVRARRARDLDETRQLIDLAGGES